MSQHKSSFAGISVLLLLTLAIFVQPAFAQTIIVDNSYVPCCFSVTGSWTTETSPTGFYGTNYRKATPGNGSKTATFSNSVTVPGVYDVYAWWVNGYQRAFDAPYTINNNGVNLDTVRVNQIKNGGKWNLLGTYPLEAGTLKVILTDTPSGYVTADAIRAVFRANSLVKITSPSNLALKPSTTVSVTASAMRFPPNWGVEFVMDGNFAGSKKDFSAPAVQTFSGLSKAEHTVDVYMLDDNNTRQPAYHDSVDFGVGDYYVAFGDSVTRGSGDNITSDNTSLDGRNTGGGYPPILNNLLTANKGYPHSIANEGVSGNTSLDGLNRLPTALTLHPDSRFFLICFGRNDSFPTGQGLSPGNSGYAGSYKDYMQRIITNLVQAGKRPMLAKIPPVLANCSSCSKFPNPDIAPINLLYKEYNLVIDELVDANSIPVVPPDLYTYYLNHKSEFATDKEHFTGVGYQSMANLWFGSLIGNTPPPPPPPPVNGSLSGSLASTSGTIDLTAVGSTDWCHWGLSTSTSFDHKSGVSQQISNYVKLGGATVIRLADNPTSFSWSNGTPTATATNTRTGIRVQGLNNGFQITVPADLATRTLRLYVGLWRAQAKLEATLSDGSASTYLNTNFFNQYQTANGVYTLTFSAASAGQTLTVKYTLKTSYDTSGNVTLEAATLAGGGGGSADDFNGDGKPDLVSQNQSNGSIGVWFMDDSNRISATNFSPGQITDTAWKIVGIADFNSDSKPDLVWQNQSNGQIGVWFMDGSNRISATNFSPGQVTDLNWKIVGIGDFNSDSKPDLVWQNQSNGQIGVWFMNGINLISAINFSPDQVSDTTWKIVGTGDFNSDSKPDLIWQNQSDGQIGVWFMDGSNLISTTNFNPGPVTDTAWKIVGTGDFNSDSKPDLLWQNQSDGQIGVWFMDGSNLINAVNFSPGRVTNLNWRIPNIWALISNH